MDKADLLQPLRQYLDTKIAQKYQDASLKRFQYNISNLQPKWQNVLKRNKKYAVNFVKKFKQIKDNGKGYYLFSKTPGSGKTMLACCILNGLKRHNITTQAITTIDFLKRIKQTFDQDRVSESSIINPLLAIDVLLLDDCGSERYSDWTTEQMFHVINSRYNAGKITFFTSNYTVDDLSCDDRIQSRINDMSVQVMMPEMDIRNLISKENERDFLNKISN